MGGFGGKRKTRTQPWSKLSAQFSSAAVVILLTEDKQLLELHDFDIYIYVCINIDICLHRSLSLNCDAFDTHTQTPEGGLHLTTIPNFAFALLAKA